MKTLHIALVLCGSLAIAAQVWAADPAPAAGAKAGAAKAAPKQAAAKKAPSAKAKAKSAKKGAAGPAAGKAAKSAKALPAAPEKPMPVQAKGMGGSKGVASSAEKAPLRFNPSGSAKAP
jgi:hypothetical protein